MNIKDLPKGSYKVVTPAKMNVKDLPKGSYKSSSAFPPEAPKEVQQSFFQRLTDLSGSNTQGIIPDIHFNPTDVGNMQAGQGVLGATLRNQVKSVANLGVGAAQFLDPVANAKKIGQGIARGVAYQKQANETQSSQQAVKDYITRLQKTLEKVKATELTPEQETFRSKATQIAALERLIKEAGGQTVTNPTFNTEVAKELPKALYENVAPAAVKKGVSEGQKGGFAEGFHAAVQSIAEDPQQLAPFFLLSKNFIETKLPAVDTAISKVGGLPGEAVSKVTAPVKNAVQYKAVNDLYNTYNEVFTGTKSAKKTFDKSVATGKDPAAFGAQNGYIVDVTKGKYNSQPTISQVKTEYIEPRATVLDDLLAAKDKTISSTDYVSLDKIAEQAKKGIEKNPLAKGSGTLSEQQAAIDKIITELKKQYGDKVPYKILNEIKKAQWAESSSFDLSKPKFMGDVNYQIGRAAADTIETNVPEAAIKRLNQEIGNAYDFTNNLRKIDGGAVKGGRLGGYFARTVGAIAGVHAGPFGSIAGALAGNYISELMQNRAITTPLKRYVLESITPDSSLYAEAQLALHRLQNTPAYPELGQTTQQTIKPSDLGQQPMNSLIKVNNYQSKFPKYLTPDQINAATEMLNQLQNQGKTIDMKAINGVVKRVKAMSDIKPMVKQMANAQDAARINRISKIPVKRK